MTPTPNTLDLDRLAEVAKAATPTHDVRSPQFPRERFVSTFDPPTVQALIERAREADKLRAELKKVKAERDEACNDLDQMDGVHLRAQLAERENDTIRAELAEANARAEKAEAERDKATRILAECVNSIGNGAGASIDCSLDFFSHAPREIGLHVASLTEDLGETKSLLAALRSELAEAKAERDAMQRDRAALSDKLNGTPCAEIAWAQEREILIEALKPFARIGQIIDDYARFKGSSINLKDYGEHFVAARAALDVVEANSEKGFPNE